MQDDEDVTHLIGSIESLPSIRKLRDSAAALSVFSLLPGNANVLDTAKHVNAELDRIVDTVKEFYRVLGKRNWVFYDALNLD